MTGIRAAAIAVLAAFVALTSGCYMISIRDPMNREDAFHENLRTFTQYVRWGNLAGAAEYIVEDQRDDFLALTPQLSDVRFTDYEILRQDLNETRDSGTADVALTGYLLSSPISRTMHLRQQWTRTGSDWKVRVELGPMREALGLAAK
jgi:hypothetical protein